MLSSAAVRLSAIEALCPTACLAAQSGYPTMAEAMVLDSRSIAIQELRPDRPFTPVIGIFTADERRRPRGEITDASDQIYTTTLEIVAELAVSGVENGTEYADAMLVGDDNDARLTLDALCAQIDYTLEHSEAGSIFRRMVRQVVESECLTFAVPQLGLRYQRVTIRKICEIRIPDFEVPAGELPEPIRTIASLLPAGSYAGAKLARLASQFRTDPRKPLEAVEVESGPITFGIGDLSP